MSEMDVLSVCVNMSGPTSRSHFSPEMRANRQVLNSRETESSSWYQPLDCSGQQEVFTPESGVDSPAIGLPDRG